MIGSDVEEFLAALILEKGESENTCAAYRADLGRFAAFLARRGKGSCFIRTRDRTTPLVLTAGFCVNGA